MNEALFIDKVQRSGLKIKFICHELGISECGFSKKRKGTIPFKVCEINKITELLNLTAPERDAIFDLKSSI